MKIKIVDRYILEEMIPPFLLGIFGFILILITDIIFTLMDLIINRGIPLYAVLRLLIYKLPSMVSEEIIRQMVLKQPLPAVSENVFFKDSGSNRYFYIRRVNQRSGELENIMVYEFEGSKVPRVIIAEKGKLEAGSWNIVNGVIHKYDDNGYLVYEAKFDKMHIAGTLDVISFSEQKTPQEMSSFELKNMITMLDRGGVNTKSLLVDYYMKYSIPLTCLIFALIGIPLSIPPIRSARAWGIVLCIVIVFSFYVFASIFRSFGYGGLLTPLVSAWGPQVIFGMLGGLLIIREGYFK
ncbi:MAG: LptF/LptG family permease [Candidatus Saganbacteria bacterium]|nr:LptF/LptG family permease [Candidatus Saganbacteria bacterium]